MPATVDDIINQRNAAASVFDDRIKAALALQQQGATGLEQRIDDFGDKEGEIMSQARGDILANANFQAALALLQTATTNMNVVAANMTTVTNILNNAATFLGYGTDVVNAIKSVSRV
jgi:flagellin-like hook-associated protein FlgL